MITHNKILYVLLFFFTASHMQEMSYNFDDESSLDVSSPRCLNSPSVSINILIIEYIYRIEVFFIALLLNNFLYFKTMKFDLILKK